MKRKLFLFSSIILLTSPLVTFAVPSSNLTLDSVTGALTRTITNFIWPLFIGFAIIMFIIAGVQFINNKPSDGRSALLWGIIGVAVGVLAFSLPWIVARLLGTPI